MNNIDRLPSNEISLETIAVLDVAKKIIDGTHRFNEPGEDESELPEAFSGSFLDLNVATDPDKTLLLEWIAEKLGTPIELAPTRAQYVSPDEQTTVKVFYVPLGPEDDPWFFSKWQNQGQEPSFMFWPEMVYQLQVVDSGYSEVS